MARNLERAGLPRSVAIKLAGHKTEYVYRQYAIADERRRRALGRRGDGFVANYRRRRRKAFGYAATSWDES